MDILHPHCAGLDVHKDTVVACVRHCTPQGKVTQQTRTFATHTAALLSLLDWLRAEGVSHAALESTGVYWKPIFHLLEGHLEVLLVNARHVKQVPGRKTDVRDAAWLAELLQHGLLRASFVPPAPIRQLRDLTRQRTRLAEEKAAAANRIQKVLEDANLKLASVATDVLGESGRAMLRALIAGETDPAALAKLARGRLRAKIPQLQLALRGRVTEHHRFLLQLYLEHVDHLEGLMGRLSGRIEEVLAPQAGAVDRLKTIPGVSDRLAEVLVAELGTDMSPFPSADHLASWAGMCPGQDQSAGKRRSGRVPMGNRWLKQALVQAGWAASHTKETYLSAQYHRLAQRRGRKRAVVALGHTLLVIVYHVLRRGGEYQELGAGYLDALAADRLTRQLVRRLEKLGHKVTLEPCAVT
jgi:transposase